MTRQEIENKIKALKKRAFFLAMKDRWNESDYELDRKLSKEIDTLQEELKNVK